MKNVQRPNVLPESATRARAILEAWTERRPAGLQEHLSNAAALIGDEAVDAGESERLELLGGIAKHLLNDVRGVPAFLPLLRVMANPAFRA
jgi:hypothetical protein